MAVTMPRLSAPAARASESDSVAGPAGTRPAARTTTIVVLGLACLSLGLACMTGVQQGVHILTTSRPVTLLADNDEVQGILTSLKALQQKHVGYVADSRFSDGQHEEATGGRQTMWEVVGRVQVADALEAAPKPLALAGVDSQIQTCQTTAVWLWVLFTGTESPLSNQGSATATGTTADSLRTFFDRDGHASKIALVNIGGAGHTFVIVKLGTKPTIVPLMSWVNQYPLEDFIDSLIAGDIASGDDAIRVFASMSKNMQQQHLLFGSAKALGHDGKTAVPKLGGEDVMQAPFIWYGVHLAPQAFGQDAFAAAVLKFEDMLCIMFSTRFMNWRTTGGQQEVHEQVAAENAAMCEYFKPLQTCLKAFSTWAELGCRAVCPQEKLDKMELS